MKPSTFDVVIAGAGIVGAACAAEFADAGLRVAVVEPGEVGGAATSAGMGHVVVMDDSEAQFALTRYAQQLWDELAARFPDPRRFHRYGTIWVAADDDEWAEVRRKKAYFAGRKVDAGVLDARALAEAEPNLRPGLMGGLLVIDDAVVDAPYAARFLMGEAEARGAVLIQGNRVTAMDGRAVTLDDGTTISTGLSINATGAWASLLSPGWVILKRKGQLVVTTEEYPDFVRHELVELGYLKSAHGRDAESVAFNVQPRPNGQVLIGSSRQFGVDDPAVEPAVIRRMVDRAIEYMPGLANLTTLRTWAGFRAATPDNLPLIGPHPTREGLYLATGHEGLGITTSLATAKLLADQALARTPAIPWLPYLPARALQTVST